MGRLSSTKDSSSETTRSGTAKSDRRVEKDSRDYTGKEVRTANEEVVERTVWDEV